MNATVLSIPENAPALPASEPVSQAANATGSGSFGTVLAAARTAVQSASEESNGSGSKIIYPGAMTKVLSQALPPANPACKKITNTTTTTANSSYIAGVLLSQPVTPNQFASLSLPIELNFAAVPQPSMPTALPGTLAQVPASAKGMIPAPTGSGIETGAPSPAEDAMSAGSARNLLSPGNFLRLGLNSAGVASRSQEAPVTTGVSPAVAATHVPSRMEDLADNGRASPSRTAAISADHNLATSDAGFRSSSPEPSSAAVEIATSSAVATPREETPMVSVASTGASVPADPLSPNPAKDQTSNEDANTTPAAAPEKPSASPDPTNLLSAILGGSAASASPALPNPLAAATLVQSAPQATPEHATPVRSGRETNFKVQTLAAANSRATSLVLSAASGESGESSLAASSLGESSLARQTPFAVFFASSGPGAESAAATLPKMILPGSDTAFHTSHAAGSDASTSSPQPVSLDSSGHNAVSGDLVSTSESGTAGASPATHHDVGPNQTEIDAAIPQSAAVVAPTSTVAVATAPGAPTAMMPETTPKSTPLPDASSAAEKSAAPIAETIPVAAAAPVQMAQLISRPEISEMRIGINTSAFGSVEVRTVIHANDVGLVIGSDKGDLRGFLQSDMPAIASTLQEQNLRLHTVNFMQGFAFSNNASGGGSGDSQPRSFVAARASPDGVLADAAANPSDELPPIPDFTSGSLSILA